MMNSSSFMARHGVWMHAALTNAKLCSFVRGITLSQIIVNKEAIHAKQHGLKPKACASEGSHNHSIHTCHSPNNSGSDMTLIIVEKDTVNVQPNRSTALEAPLMTFPIRFQLAGACSQLPECLYRSLAWQSFPVKPAGTKAIGMPFKAFDSINLLVQSHETHMGNNICSAPTRYSLFHRQLSQSQQGLDWNLLYCAASPQPSPGGMSSLSLFGRGLNGIAFSRHHAPSAHVMLHTLCSSIITSCPSIERTLQIFLPACACSLLSEASGVVPTCYSPEQQHLVTLFHLQTSVRSHVWWCTPVVNQIACAFAMD
jgi:hypothetical protein